MKLRPRWNDWQGFLVSLWGQWEPQVGTWRKALLLIRDQDRQPGHCCLMLEYPSRTFWKSETLVISRDGGMISSGETPRALGRMVEELHTVPWPWPPGHAHARHPVPSAPAAGLTPHPVHNPLPKTEVTTTSSSKALLWLCQELGISLFSLLWRE